MKYLGIDLPFTHQSGSKVWPSSDPEDSPFDCLICNYCGYKLSYQAYGDFMPGHALTTEEIVNRPLKNAVADMEWHVERCPCRNKNKEP